jgi:mannitol/fructose-specific phosphotransferase system IIA component (Ntr-type)
LIASQSDAFHLKLLTRVSRTISQPDLLTQLREAPDARQAKLILIEAEQQLE